MTAQDAADKAWGEAWSLCSEEEWPDREWIGERQEGNRVYTMWRKKRGDDGDEDEYGYTTEIIVDGVRVPEEVAIFGRRVTSYADKEERRKMRWMKRRNAAQEGQCQG